jgi:uncharacterized membrane protein
MMLVPIGMFATVVGLLGAVAYRVYSQDGSGSSGDSIDTTPEEPPLATLERRYAEGEIDDEEYERRRGRLTDEA